MGADNFDRSFMRGHDPAADAESESCATPRTGLVDAIESVEHVRNVLGGYPDSRVFDHQFDSAIERSKPHENGAPGISELDGVVEKVRHELPQVQSISDEPKVVREISR